MQAAMGPFGTGQIVCGRRRPRVVGFHADVPTASKAGPISRPDFSPICKKKVNGGDFGCVYTEDKEAMGVEGLVEMVKKG